MRLKDSYGFIYKRVSLRGGRYQAGPHLLQVLCMVGSKSLQRLRVSLIQGAAFVNKPSVLRIELAIQCRMTLNFRSFSFHLLSAGFIVSQIYSTWDRTQDFMHAQPTKQHTQLLKILNGHQFYVYH